MWFAAALLVFSLAFAVWLNLRLPAWPQGAVLFGLGVHSRRTGWLVRVPRELQRRAGRLTISATVAMVALVAGVVGTQTDELETRADPFTLAFALLDGVIAVAFVVWLVTWLRRRGFPPNRWVERAARGSFATYVVHPLVLTVIMLGLATAPVPPELEFVLVAATGVPVCFAAGYGLTRLPGIFDVL
jgi:peptidoglycan/LPS O-acetylase OafA/YrhL